MQGKKQATTASTDQQQYNVVAHRESTPSACRVERKTAGHLDGQWEQNTNVEGKEGRVFATLSTHC